MKILQLVNRIPYPLNDGGSLGIHYYTQGFIDAGVRLSMLAMNTTRHWVEEQNLPPLYRQLEHFVTVKVDNRVKPLPALLNLFGSSSYNIDRFVTTGYRNALVALLQQETFDVIQLESLFLVPYIPVIRQYSKAKVVIRQHNIEYRIWERLAAQAGNPLKKWYLRLLARRLKQFELRHLDDYDLILPISEADLQLLQALGVRKPMFLHPFGIDMAHIPYCPATEQPLSLYHIGAMDWLPNQESVNWLLEQVMPLVSRELPCIKLHLAGRNMPEYYLKNTWPNVVVAGEVPDAMAFERDKSMLLVPLLSGGGVRIKIFQGMAMGKTIVTTPVGLEGIEARDGQDVLVAETPEAFARKIIGVVREPGQLTAIGTAARRLIEEKYDRKKLIAALLDRYRRL
ncbi:glycosyltransferase family 4 protein [Taibaiella chishuiensis]|uniref:Glycosyltransferase involved in cell wall biosynthesis n=1 Tax=Taibaiella chishuiensis TaxID=1434707 RepID=A0A2P8DC40_9BACT|nr:glycosyltransferase family 4 protein [Taibaiella chishuiensis]PSK94755.1 glycosyltransferase involved in cell wall biosynthesis [Taibaiella chishuiensis]